MPQGRQRSRAGRQGQLEHPSVAPVCCCQKPTHSGPPVTGRSHWGLPTGLPRPAIPHALPFPLLPPLPPAALTPPQMGGRRGPPRQRLLLAAAAHAAAARTCREQLSLSWAGRALRLHPGAAAHRAQRSTACPAGSAGWPSRQLHPLCRACPPGPQPRPGRAACPAASPSALACCPAASWGCLPRHHLSCQRP